MSRRASAKASCSSLAFFAHITSSNSSSPMFSGVSRGELEARPMNDSLAELAYLGVAR